ncbi:unknown [Prevotella sp. CAG:1124]|nr:unknown [Prevotella sp. CAG:1124]
MTKNSVDTLRITFVAASCASPKCSIATKKAIHEATPINEWNMLHTDTPSTLAITRRSATGRNPYLRMSICLVTYAERTMSEHSSASDEAMAAPEMPMSRPNISSQLPGMFTTTAVIAARLSARVCVIPTSNALRASSGNENSRP